MKPAYSLLTVIVLVACLIAPAMGDPFEASWRDHWKLMVGQDCVARHDDGSLEFDPAPNEHAYFAGGQEMHDFAVTARLKFLRADDKYSGFSIYMRLQGDVWAKRSGYWVYLRPKYRSLFMQKMQDSQLDKAFPERVKAVRPKSTPIGEWMTLRCEVRGRRIEVYLNDELYLSAVDDGKFPVLSGRVAFGAGNAHVILADLTQENLEKSERVTGVSYSYVNPPTRGDEDASILTDGKVNPRQEQAFWRMLGPRPEIVFDLGEERFVTRIVLRAISSPAVNISSAEILGSADKEAWDTLAVLENKDARRGVNEHEMAGDVRRVARYVKVVLARPAADQDVELAEVEFYGREPTEEDRLAGAAAAYSIGPDMPPTSEAPRRDDNYWYLSAEGARFAIDRAHGMVAGAWNLGVRPGTRRTVGAASLPRPNSRPERSKSRLEAAPTERPHAMRSRAYDGNAKRRVPDKIVGPTERQRQPRKCIERLPDKYHLYTRDGDSEASEYQDRVEAVLEDRGETLRLRCANPALPDVSTEKTYSLSPDGRRLVKRVSFTSTSDDPGRFLTHGTGGVLAEEFRRGGVYMGCDRGLGARLFADKVKVPTRVSALGSRNAKVVLFIRYDLGWGVAQYRYKINDRYCRPVTSRWHEKENHPPVYLPNGWEMGLCTLHLAPREEQSTETHLALFDGRQYDFYGMYRKLPEVAEQYASVRRPEWVKDLKTSCDVALNPLTADLTGALLAVERTVQMAESGTLWKLTQIHGVWGQWSTEGIVTNGYGAKLDAQWLKDYIAAVHALSPRVKIGVYTWAWAVHPHSKVYREHPEWFITTDRNGQVFNAYSNMVLNHARRFGIKASMDECMDQFARVIRDFGGDFFYLDGGGGGQNLIDWEHLGCDQDYHYEELYRRIREATRACGNDKGVWFNARTGPYWDIGYYEGVDQRLRAATWRESADGFSAIKIRHAYDPGQVVIPLYWRSETLPFFSNYCIGLGITPSRPLGAARQREALPFIEAAYETRGLRWTEADLEPDWRTDPDTQIEAYALRRGEAAIISLVDHREDGDGTAHVSADAVKLGLNVERPIYVWTFGMRDIREAWPTLPDSTRRDVYERSGWGLDLVGRLLRVEVIENPTQRIELAVPTEPHLLRMVILNNSPVGVFSVRPTRVSGLQWRPTGVSGLRRHPTRVSGLRRRPTGLSGPQRTNLWLPENLGASGDAELSEDGKRLVLEANAPEGGAEFIVAAPPGKTLTCAEVKARSLLVRGHSFLVVPVAAAKREVELMVTDQAPSDGRLDLDGPEKAEAGATIELRPRPTVQRGLVSVWRNGVLVFADERASEQGALRVQVPEEVHGGTFTVQVAAVVGGKMLTGERAVEITGGFEPELAAVSPPKRGPQVQVSEVNKTVGGLRVLQAGTDTHDGYDGGLFAQADAEQLVMAGGSLDAPRSRYGYGFGGLELEGARVLTLKVTNTFHDAWIFYRHRISYHPSYTSTFAGLMVDYHTPQGYAKRVALGLGLINPKRKTPRPRWGAKAAPIEFISLADAIHEGAETELTIDLGKWAPPDWDGRCWLSAGTDNVLPSRRIHVKIIEASDSREGKEITEGESVGDLYKLRSYRVSRASSAPEIDGNLDDEVWKTTRCVDRFGLLGRLGASTQNTRAWLAYDDQNLYVAFDCSETEKKLLSTSAKKIWNQDAVDLALDVDADRGGFQQFIVNCIGDMEQFSQRTGGVKEVWKVDAAVGKREGGWAVEMAIPWGEIKLRPRPGMKWTGNFVRYRPNPPDFEIQTWSPIPGDSLIVPERFGELVFE